MLSPEILIPFPSLFDSLKMENKTQWPKRKNKSKWRIKWLKLEFSFYVLNQEVIQGTSQFVERTIKHH